MRYGGGKRYLLIPQFLVCIALLLPALAKGEQRQLNVSIAFPVNRTELRPDFGNNADQLAKLEDFIDSLDIEALDTIPVSGYASPEGPYSNNLRLAKGRAQSLIDYIVTHSAISPDQLSVGECGLAWEALRPLIEGSQIQQKAEILTLLNTAIANTDEETQLQVLHDLQTMEHGRIWTKLKRDFFPQVRSCQMKIIVNYKPQPEPEIIIEPEPEPAIIPEPEPEPTPDPVVEVMPEYSRWHLKTNGIGWLMLVSNIAAEYDFANRWSVALPIYYSGWNYFSSRTKFRTFTVQPELRFWLRDTGNNENRGWFVGAHFGLGYFNYATKDHYRIQDHDGSHPALGGGIAAGYRMPLSGHWKLEFSIGCGVYSARYDKYDNYHNGPRVFTDIHKTWFGIDQAAVSLAYTFETLKKGGNQ